MMWYGLWLLSLFKKDLPYPAMPVRLVKDLDSVLRKNMAVFEYGCGNSSLFFASRCGRYDCAEHDFFWYKKMLKHGMPNANISFCPDKKDYIRTLARAYDIVIVDGVHRKECFNRAFRFVKKPGLVILDDSNRYNFYDRSRPRHSYGGIRFFSVANSRGFLETNTAFLYHVF